MPIILNEFPAPVVRWPTWLVFKITFHEETLLLPSCLSTKFFYGQISDGLKFAFYLYAFTFPWENIHNLGRFPPPPPKHRTLAEWITLLSYWFLIKQSMYACVIQCILDFFWKLILLLTFEQLERVLWIGQGPVLLFNFNLWLFGKDNFHSC